MVGIINVIIVITDLVILSTFIFIYCNLYNYCLYIECKACLETNIVAANAYTCTVYIDPVLDPSLYQYIIINYFDILYCLLMFYNPRNIPR